MFAALSVNGYTDVVRALLESGDLHADKAPANNGLD